MANPTVREIVEGWLREHGFDGLCREDCGCEIGDLMPCEDMLVVDGFRACIPGHKRKCTDPECLCEGTQEHVMADEKEQGDADKQGSKRDSEALDD